MRVSTKIIVSTTIIIMVLFTGLGTILIGNNFNRSYTETKENYTRTHFQELNAVKNNLYVEINRGQELNSDLLVQYVNRFVSFSETASAAVILDGGEVLYNSIGNKFTEDAIKKYAYKYEGKSITISENKNRYMIMSSQTKIGKVKYIIIHIFNVTEVFRNRNEQVKFFAFMLCAAMLLSVFLVWIVTTLVTNPISKLNDVSKQIANGDYAVRTNIKSKDEIGELSVSFDQMVKSVEENIKRRESFITDFSHELKTPMTAIVGYSDILRSQQCDEDEKFEYANYIYRSGKRLEGLSTSMMALLGLSEEEMLFTKVGVKQIKNALMFIFKAYQEIEVVYELESAMLFVEKELVITLLRNVIDNARKAEPSDGKVVVQGTVEEEVYCIKVRDTGRGMTKEELEHVTEAFYMADKSRSRSQGGAGIGLSICEKICELHGTKLHFESEVGRGTTVSFELEVWHE